MQFSGNMVHSPLKCGERGHYQRDCPGKGEIAKCSMMLSTQRKKLPEWVKTVKINGEEVEALLDTVCSKTVVHPSFVKR